jgi:hypothetical protein
MMENSSDSAVIRADFSTFRHVPSRKVFQIVCEVPIERANEALRVLGMPNIADGTPVAIARMNPIADRSDRASNDGSDRCESAPPSEGDKDQNSRRSLSQEAWLLCRRKDFHDYLGFDQPDAETRTIEWLKLKCGINSRSDLDHNKDAAAAFISIKSRFERDWKPNRTMAG